QRTHEFTLTHGITSVDFAPDGRHLAAGCNTGVTVILRLAPAPVTPLTVTPSPSIAKPVPTPPALESPLALLDPAKIAADEREPNQPKELVAVVGSRHMRHWGIVNHVAISREGKTIASVGDDRKARLWDVATLREKAVIDGAANFIGFYPDGKTT